MEKQDLKKRTYIELVISDTGKGITLENMDSIFDLYFSTKDVGEGTGMGLAMELRKTRKDVRIILCTGYSSKISPEIARDIGIDAFSYKPFSKADLAITVQEVLGKV